MCLITLDYTMAQAACFVVFVFLCVVQLVVCQKTTPTPPVQNEDKRHGCERVTFPCTGGMPGIPGANGMPGITGPYGARGDKGDSGDQGKPGTKGDRGLKGIVGNPGSKGLQGKKGDRGSRGHAGSPGKTGQSGLKGDRGSSGAKGDAGQKGDAAAAGPISPVNWKQCAWNKINDDRDSGKLKECSFNKLQGNTALKVSFEGVLRVIGDALCNRWYFKFNGNECSGPMAIEAIIYNDWQSGNPNLHHHRSFEGYCENLPRGAINVELWVGSCPSWSIGDAYTGWNSVSRIMVEEVPRSQ